MCENTIFVLKILKYKKKYLTLRGNEERVKREKKEEYSSLKKLKTPRCGKNKGDIRYFSQFHS